MYDLADAVPFDISYSKRSTKKVTIHRSPIVNKADWEPISVIEPDEESGPWIAGGACIHWFSGQPVNGSDIDVFCKNPAQSKKVIDRIQSYGRHDIMAETDNAVTFRYYNKDDDEKSWLIQVIICRYFDTLPEILDSFDLSVCQIGTAGDKWTLGKHTALDIKNKKLRFVNELRPDSVKRLTKYWTYGYMPVEGTLEMLLTNDDIEWNFKHEEYSNAF